MCTWMCNRQSLTWISADTRRQLHHKAKNNFPATPLHKRLKRFYVLLSCWYSGWRAGELLQRSLRNCFIAKNSRTKSTDQNESACLPSCPRRIGDECRQEASALFHSCGVRKWKPINPSAPQPLHLLPIYTTDSSEDSKNIFSLKKDVKIGRHQIWMSHLMLMFFSLGPCSSLLTFILVYVEHVCIHEEGNRGQQLLKT